MRSRVKSKLKINSEKIMESMNKTKKICSYFFTLKYLPIILLLAGSGCSTGFYLNDEYSQYVRPAFDYEVEYRVLLIGDAGSPSLDKREPVLKAMEERAALLPDKTINIFLGDNIYSLGLEPEGSANRKKSEQLLDEQIKIMLNSNAEGVFIPGNHDWGFSSNDGWDRMKDQTEYINRNYPLVQMLPGNGCPGPVYKDYGDVLRVIYIDTQWWLHPRLKPGPDNSDCYPAVKESVVTVLDSMIQTAGEKAVLITGHHPLKTYGAHGGYFTWRHHIFPLTDFNKLLWIPLPLIGSVYPLLRTSGISEQDISNSEYQNLIGEFESVFSKHSNIIYAAGHEHTLQVIRGTGNNIYLISGYGTSDHNSNVSYGDDSILSVLRPGFMQLDITSNNRIRLGVFAINKENTVCEEVFSKWLFE
jgi:hypothetical protein